MLCMLRSRFDGATTVLGVFNQHQHNTGTAKRAKDAEQTDYATFHAGI